ncbi:hypothetical protein GGI12_000394 [Dipsacomyces acuminosporus]|nr:hypothetical protein GGI12_000394 [Dipsacomyces acuminosporus]
MSRSGRRHARKASATTAEEIMLPMELMVGLTSALSPPVASGEPLPGANPGNAEINTNSAPQSADGAGEGAGASITKPSLSFDLAPLFPDTEMGSQRQSSDLALNEGPSLTEQHQQHQQHQSREIATDGAKQPNKGILKEPKKAESSNGSRWSLWPGAKKWLLGSAYSSEPDLPARLTFAHGAGIPAVRQSADDVQHTRLDARFASRTAPSLDFERSTSIVPPLSQERIKSTEFWTNFALELDPSKLKRIRFSMPLIVTEFDPETSRVYDPDGSVTSFETSSNILRSPAQSDDADDLTDLDDSQYDDDNNDDGDDDNNNNNNNNGENGDGVGGSDETNNDRVVTESSADLCHASSATKTNTDAAGNTQTVRIGSQDTGVQDSASNGCQSDADSIPDMAVRTQGKQSIQWNVEALTNRQYRVQEVWELYERTCRSLDIDPLPSFEEILWSHMRKEQTLGSLDLSGSRLDGVHMKCFADILDLNFGLVKLELNHCSIDDDAARLLVYSLLCNDSVRYLSLANNARLRSDGIRYISILIRHSKQLQLLDISGITIRKKSAGYLAAALAGLGSNWSLGRGSMHKKNTMYEKISLQALRMNSCGIKPAALAILASGVRLSPLQHLSLRLNSLTGSSGPILREMLYGDPPQLSSHKQSVPPRRPISVSLHGLSDAQHCRDPNLSPMAMCFDETPRVSQLRSLDLSQNDLGRALMDLAEGLLWNTNLRGLVLRQNKLQPQVLASFVESLEVNSGLVYLDVSRNPVCGPNTVALDVLAEVLCQNRTLKGLFMSATGMTSEGAIILAECLPDLHTLERMDVSENPGIDIAGLMALSASIKLNKSLICLEITVNTGDEVCAALEQAIAQTCIANMQRLDASASKHTSSEDSGDASDDFGFGLVSTHVWPHADMAPGSDIPGVVESKVSGEADRSELTSLVTDIAAVKRPSFHGSDGSTREPGEDCGDGDTAAKEQIAANTASNPQNVNTNKGTEDASGELQLTIPDALECD